MKVVGTMAEARAERRGVVGLVPTMGFFHEGHLSLMERSVSQCDLTVVTLYVNPLQFDDPGDLARYPVDHDRDLDLADQLGVDVMVVPDADEMFAAAPLTRVSVAGIGDRLESHFRPGHMTGVATVVTKLFAGLQPDVAYFGRKDAQQLAMVTRLGSDLGFPIRVVGCPLIREPDGLALSSRNILLGDRREEALGLSRALMKAAEVFEAGERSSELVEEVVRSDLDPTALDYVEACDANTMERVTNLEGEVVLAVAARVGSIRLIDNVRFRAAGNSFEVDRGVWLDSPSVLYSGRAGAGVTG